MIFAEVFARAIAQPARSVDIDGEKADGDDGGQEDYRVQKAQGQGKAGKVDLDLMAFLAGLGD